MCAGRMFLSGLHSLISRWSKRSSSQARAGAGAGAHRLRLIAICLAIAKTGALTMRTSSSATLPPPRSSATRSRAGLRCSGRLPGGAGHNSGTAGSLIRTRTRALILQRAMIAESSTRVRSTHVLRSQCSQLQCSVRTTLVLRLSRTSDPSVRD